MDSNGARLISDTHFLGSTISANHYGNELNDGEHTTTISTYENTAFESESNELSDLKDSAINSCCYGADDDTIVYANSEEINRLKELEKIDRRSSPPYPSTSAQPLRVIANGWKEYQTLGGRSFYFHPDKRICQWKPPRTTGKFYVTPISNSGFTSEVQHASTSTEMPEILPVNEARNQFCSSQTANTLCHKSVIIDSTIEHMSGTNKGIMSHSLDGVICQSKFPSECTAESIGNCFAYDISSNAATSIHRDTAVKHGFLERCKHVENGVKLKRKDWSSAYAYLYIGHLLFYKDQKSAEKNGKHYPAPFDVCDLRDASVSFIDDVKKQRDKRKKLVVSLLLSSKTEYHFSGSEEDINEWFHALRQAITSSPVPKTPTTIISDWNGSLQRSLRHKRDSGGITFGIGKTTFHNSIKSRLKSSATNRTISDDHFSSSAENSADEVTPPAKAKIIERLLRFFRSRPSMESLRERGIYKPEPVFGSTLSEICSREKSTVPKFIIEVTTLIEQKGLDSDGLYRVNGNLSSVQKIRCQIDQDCYDVMRREEDIHVLSGALKLFLRELQEPVFPVSMHRDFMFAMRESGIKRLRRFDELLFQLPLVNRQTLRVLVLHLNRVATHSSKNRMQLHNLAIIFGPSLFCSDDRSNNLRKSSQDRGKPGCGGKKKSINKRQEDGIESGSNLPVEPTQNLAHRMIVYGQILECVLTDYERLTLFIE